MATMHEQVLEFMKKHDQAVLPQFGVPDPEIVMLRVRLIVEECAELCIALHQDDLIGIMDACADLRYVVVGTAIAFGFKANDQFGTVPGVLALPAYQGGSWVKLNHYRVIQGKTNMLIDLLCRSTMQLSFDELNVIYGQLRVSVNNLLMEIGYIDALYQIPAQEVFAEVHRSNMTKNKLDKHSKGGKVSKKGFTPPNFKQFLFSEQ